LGGIKGSLEAYVEGVGAGVYFAGVDVEIVGGIDGSGSERGERHDSFAVVVVGEHEMGKAGLFAA